MGQTGEHEIAATVLRFAAAVAGDDVSGDADYGDHFRIIHRTLDAKPKTQSIEPEGPFRMG
ncbi:MAG: hypothetical protein ABSH46_09895 [Bryobacteraceae bacterium]|jgi:hypothetical protein